MDLTELIDQLSSPSAYAHPTGVIDVRQTHVSVVFLAGEFAYKIKKPVNLGFLDFTTLEGRHRVCLDEVRLNRRLAHRVYLGVVPVVRTPRGIGFGAQGETVEWAVRMRRLPDEAALSAKLQRGDLPPEQLEAVARHIASFHRSADRGTHIAAFGKFDVVAGNARENFAQAAPEVDVTVSPFVFADLRDLTEASLSDLRSLIDRRAERGVPCDGHGDLRLEHVYLFPNEAPPGDWVIIDCLEYTERFRFADPVNDIAFTVMELLFAGNAEGAQRFADAYFRSAGDEEGRRLLPFYIAYRSIVRGKVRGFELREPEIPAERRTKSLARAKAHFLLALGVLASPLRRPALGLVAGLPGTGKSTLARALAERAGFEVIRSDVVRKELAGLPPGEPAASGWQSGIYADDWTRRTYDECRKRTEKMLFEGKRVLVDATFATDALRVEFLETARRFAVPALLFVCEAPVECVRERLAHRRGDASDADTPVYEKARAAWEHLGTVATAALVTVETAEQGHAIAHALAALGDHGLA